MTEYLACEIEGLLKERWFNETVITALAASAGRDWKREKGAGEELWLPRKRNEAPSRSGQTLPLCRRA